LIPEAERFKDCLAQHFEIDDWLAVDIILACVVAHKIGGEMLWLRIIGASGSGKTEILRTLLGQEGYIETVETLTPSAIRRGLQMVKKRVDKDGQEEYQKVQTEPTLLERINKKLVITKELAPLLTRHHDTRLEIFGLLRSVHDGELDADYGSLQGHIKQKCWFDWILGTTTYVDSQNQLEMQLGSRFTDLRWGSPLSRKKAVSRAIQNIPHIEAIRAELSGIMTSLIAHSDTANAGDFQADLQSEEWLLDLCEITSVLRTPVERDGYTREVKEKSIPSPELGTRIGQNYAKIMAGLRMLGVENVQPYITRLTWDALPPMRATVLRAILTLEASGRKPSEELIACNNGSGLSKSTVHLVSKDLQILGAERLNWRSCLK